MMRSKTPSRSLCFITSVLSIGLLFCVGCGPKGPDGLVPAYGTVTLDGKPLANAQIIFRHPTRGESVGRTDKNGDYKMAYTFSKEGAFVGENTVSFSTTVVFNDDEVSDEDLVEDEDGNLGNKAERIPEKYRHENSELTVEVKPRGAPYDIDLKS